MTSNKDEFLSTFLCLLFALVKHGYNVVIFNDILINGIDHAASGLGDATASNFPNIIIENFTKCGTFNFLI